MKRYRANERGFSLVEVLLALTVVLVATAPLLHVAAAAQRLAQSQSEATDVSQRIRVAAERLRADLSAAGSGVISGPLNADFGAFVASIVPARLGSRSPDPPMSAADDRLTILYVPESAWPSALVLPMVTAAAPLAIDATAPECPAAGTCGFAAGTRALLFDASEPGAGHELFTVTETSGGLAHDSPNLPFERVYAAPDSYVLPIVQRTYYFDRPNSRLMVYDGYQTDSPLIDNVLDLRFSYFVDGRAASVMLPADGRGNCLYDAGSPPVPRLDERGSGLVELTPRDLIDGPTCGAGALAFDGDLLRVRRVRVRIRIQAALETNRGAGALFVRPGRAPSAYSFVPDYEVTFDVSPRGLMPVTFRR